MNLKIRKCNFEDCTQVDELLTKLIIDEKKYDPNIDENFKVKGFYKNFVNNYNHCILLATIDNKIVGYIYGFIETDVTNKNEKAKLDALYVESEYRRLGIAQKLIDDFLSWTEEKNIKSIEVNVCGENINAINLYKKYNFKMSKLTMNLEK